jgi:flagellar biosynthesis protein FlhG
VVAVAAGKGGAGASTVATLLAATVAADRTDVLLVDAANRLGTLGAILGVNAERGIEALRGGRAEPDELIVKVDDRLALLPSGGASVASISAAERRVLLARVTSLFPRYGLVVIDAGASADSVLAACALGVTRVLAVTADDRISVATTYALVKLLHEQYPGLRVDLLGNRVSEPLARMVQDCVNAATVRFLSRTLHLTGSIPDDPHFGIALTAGLGACVASQGSSAAAVVRAIGHSLLPPELPPPTGGSMPASAGVKPWRP